MNKCRDKENLLALYVDDSLSAEQKQVIEAHLASCPDCKRELAALQETRKWVSELADVEEPAWFQQKVMAQVRREAGQRQKKRGWFEPLRFRIPLQIAATLIIAVLAVVIYRAGGDPVTDLTREIGLPQMEMAAEPRPETDVSKPDAKREVLQKSRILTDASPSDPKAESHETVYTTDTQRLRAQTDEAPAPPQAAPPGAAGGRTLHESIAATVSAARRGKADGSWVLHVADTKAALSQVEEVLARHNAEILSRDIFAIGDVTLRARVSGFSIRALLESIQALGDLDGESVDVDDVDKDVDLIIELKPLQIK